MNNVVIDRKRIHFIKHFIIKEDRLKMKERDLKGTCTQKILLVKAGNPKHFREIYSWVINELKKQSLLLIPFPSTNKYKPQNKQLPFSLVKELCKRNKHLINGSGFLYRKYSLPKNTRDINLQYKSLQLKNNKIIKNSNILLLDDVVTTGSSLAAGMIKIKSIHPKSLQAMAIARKVYLKDVPKGGLF
jgi:predicted amidophosphoribosyltransferase